MQKFIKIILDKQNYLKYKAEKFMVLFIKWFVVRVFEK